MVVSCPVMIRLSVQRKQERNPKNMRYYHVMTSAGPYSRSASNTLSLRGRMSVIISREGLYLPFVEFCILEYLDGGILCF